jgi:hypothetical protein
MIAELKLSFPSQGPGEWLCENVLRHRPSSLRCRVGNDDPECGDPEKCQRYRDGQLEDESAVHDSTPFIRSATLCLLNHY